MLERAARAARGFWVKNQAPKVLLKLYVTGQTPRSELAIVNLRRICGEQVDEFEIVVIDVLECPQLAEDEKILATPALVKELPEPIRRVIGDLADTEKVLLGLNLSPAPARTSAKQGITP